MKLLYKEWGLAAHPTLFIFPLLGCLTIVPAYPGTVIFMFGCLAPFVTFTFARENNDAWYTATLPVTKREIVLAKWLLILTVQLSQLVISIPFALLRATLNIGNNPVGMDPTIAWYGCGLILFAVFDVIFFPAFYKSGYKAGKSFITAFVPVILLMVAVEACGHIPALAWMDSIAPENLLRQFPILIVGIIFYAGCLYAAYRVASKRFEWVDL